MSIKNFFKVKLVSALLIVIGGLLLFSMAMFYRAEISTLKRKDTEDQLKAAQAQVIALQRVNSANVAALEQVRREDHERQNFITENKIQVERGRKTGDGPVSPVLLDAAKRVRERYKAYSAGSNP